MKNKVLPVKNGRVRMDTAFKSISCVYVIDISLKIKYLSALNKLLILTGIISEEAQKEAQ